MNQRITILMLMLVVLMSGCLSSREAQKKYGFVIGEEDARAKAASDEAAARMEEEETGRRPKREADKKGRDRVNQSNDKRFVADESAALMTTADTLDLAIINYVVRGRVVGENGKPVEGIQVILLNGTANATPENLNIDDPEVSDIVAFSADTSGSDGRFHVSLQDYEAPYMRIFVRDVDGPSHGNYINEVVNVYFDDADRRRHGHGWRYDSVEKRITLKPKVRR